MTDFFLVTCPQKFCRWLESGLVFCS